MNTKARVISVYLIAAVAIFGRNANAAAPRDAEHARLIAMCGTWDVELTFVFQPGSPGVTTKGTSTITPLFDGLFVQEKIEGALNGVPFTTLSWTGYNTATKQYEATRIASTNTIRIAETGTYDEERSQFELKAEYPFAGDTWRQRTVIETKSADAMLVRSYLSFGKTPEWKGVEIKYQRRTKVGQNQQRGQCRRQLCQLPPRGSLMRKIVPQSLLYRLVHYMRYENAECA